MTHMQRVVQLLQYMSNAERSNFKKKYSLKGISFTDVLWLICRETHALLYGNVLSLRGRCGTVCIVRPQVLLTAATTTFSYVKLLLILIAISNFFGHPGDSDKHPEIVL